MNCENYKVDVPEGISGDWKVEKFIVPERDIRAITYALHGRPVEPGTYTRLMHKGAIDPMMSDTPSEIYDALGFIGYASGTILISGLGLGMVVKALLNKPEVTRIDVVELEQDIINLVAPTYKKDPRFNVYHGDAFTFQFPKDVKWDYAWHDIWPNICTDNLPEITKLKRKYARKVGHQEAWVEGELKRIQRRENRYAWSY